MPQEPPNDNLRTQAIHWLIAQHSGEWSSRDQHDFEAWLLENDRHRQHYQQIQQLWGSLDRFKADAQPQRTAAKQYRPAPEISANDDSFTLISAELPRPKPGNQRSKLSRHVPAIPLALAASLFLAVFVWKGLFTTPVEHYQTAKGEQKTVTLADGSTIVLNTDTQVTVSQSQKTRSVQLSRGEALFNIIHDPSRPFEVTADNGRIRDIGTRFDVYAQGHQVDVIVLEGEVEVLTAKPSTTRRLGAGQSAAYDANGNLFASQMKDLQTVKAWQAGKLKFSDMPLPEALAQIARYHPVDFQIDSPKLRELKISGTFKTANLKLLLKTLEAGFPLKATVTDPHHIRLRQTPPA